MTKPKIIQYSHPYSTEYEVITDRNRNTLNMLLFRTKVVCSPNSYTNPSTLSFIHYLLSTYCF